MRKTIAAGIAGIALAGGAIAVGPVIASAQDTTDDGAVVEAPVNPVDETLDDLVADGSLTQEQADAIVDAFAQHRGERGEHGGRRGAGLGDPSVVTDLLGITEEDLMAARAEGLTLAELAEANGVSVDTLIDTLVDEANTRLDEKVAAGDISAENADLRRADIEAHVTARVNGERPEGFGPQGGPGHRRGPGPDAGVDGALEGAGLAA